MTRGICPPALVAVLVSTSCATPLSSTMPARTLAQGDWALSSSLGMAVPSPELARRQRLGEQGAALAAALASGGFAHTLAVRRGLAHGLEIGLSQGGAGQLELGARYALARPDHGWDLTVGARALGAWAAADAGRRDLEIERYRGAGGALTVAIGRTWSDFVAVWLATEAALQRFDLEAMVNGSSADHEGSADHFGGALGLRVGYRHLFAAIELALARVSAETETEEMAGWILFPSFGLTVETR